jgi:hypothetical protein
VPPTVNSGCGTKAAGENMSAPSSLRIITCVSLLSASRADPTVGEVLHAGRWDGMHPTSAIRWHAHAKEEGCYMVTCLCHVVSILKMSLHRIKPEKCSSSKDQKIAKEWQEISCD